MKRIMSIIFPLAAVAALAMGTVADNASAAYVKTFGLEFKAAYGSSASCLSRYSSSFASIQNNCSYRVEVVAWLPVVNTGYKDTWVDVRGNNTWCQTVSTNGVGNGAHVGATVWTSAGPETWQTLHTGSRYLWTDTPLLVRCGLDAGESISMAHVQW